MADHLAVTVPISGIERIQIYVNSARQSLPQIQAETGADYILNGTLYNTRTFAPVCHLKVDGTVLCNPDYSVIGYAWDDGPDIFMDSLPDPARRDYIACTPLIVSSKPLSKLTYDSGQGGKRGRSVIGIKGDRLALYCTRDGGSMARTPEALRDDLAAAGWDSAVMLDGGGSSSCWFRGNELISDSDRKIHDYILVFLKKEELPVGVKTYSAKRDGSTYLSTNFRVKEFACNDGSDTVLISEELVNLLQKIRDHFGDQVIINSGYRTSTYNKQVGGATNSQHVKGTAADIVVKGATPLEVAQYTEYLQPNSGGIGVYQSFTHVDVRSSHSRWDNRSGKEVVVSGWPGYQEASVDNIPSSAHQEGVAWALENGILRGNADGDLMLSQPVTVQKLCTMMKRLAKHLGKD